MTIDLALTRRKHAQSLLNQLRHAVLADAPEPLAEHALRSPLTRRMLARCALHSAPALFAPDQDRWSAWEHTETWLHWPRTRINAFTLKLGVLALGPAIRTLVERQTVLALREMLQPELWQTAQKINPWGRSAPEAIRKMGDAVIRRCGGDMNSLKQALHARGQIEFIAHAERLDPALADRLSLSYITRPAVTASKESWLPRDTVAQLLKTDIENDAASVATALKCESTP